MINTETKVLIGVLVATVAIIVGGAFIAGRNTTAPGQAVSAPERLVREDDPVAGPTDAKVTVVEFGDFQCPACGSVYPVLKQVKADNKDKPVRFVYRHFPLPQHPHAQLAAEAAVEAQRQGKFWEYHDTLFEHQTALEKDSLQKYAQDLGLDTTAFAAALESHQHADAVRTDREDGVGVQVNSTPTILINGVPFTKQYSAANLQKAIDDALQAGQ